MPNYQNTKIYQIVPTCEHEEGEVYIGATTRPLSERMATHRKPNNPTTSVALFNKYGVENCKIELIETYPCNNKEESSQKEGNIIRERNCVNKNIPNRTTEEKKNMFKAYHKIWRNDYFQKNKEKIYDRRLNKKSNDNINV